MRTVDVAPTGAGRRVAIVAARFNGTVVRRLVDGAMDALDKYEVAEADRLLVWVPGCFELPLVAAKLADRVDAVVCLGAVIRGETSHYDLVAGEAARGIADVGRATGVPVIFGVLTTDTLSQAIDRAGGTHGNKGWDAVEAALEMAGVVTALADPGEELG